MYIALGIIILLLSLLMAAAIVYTLVRSAKDGSDLISKKNLFYLIPTFLLIYLLQLTASAYNGENIDFFYCFTLISTTLDVLKFKAVKELMLPICQEYPIYYIDFVIAFLVGGATVILSVASFFSQRISNYFNVKRLLKRNCDIVLGDSEAARKYIKNTKNCILIGTNITRREYAEIIKQGIRVLRIPLDAKLFLKKLKGGEYNIIVFRGVKFSYTEVIETFTELKKGGSDAKLHLEANQQEMKILKEKFIQQADGKAGAYITGFSKYELMARRFVADYPVTKFIPRSFYNKNFTLKSDKEINIVFVGFGKVNYQLFRMCSMQFQFAGENKGKLCSKPVNYYVYDNKDSALHNEFFSRIQYEFDEQFSGCDFPKPEKICNLVTQNIDINSVEAKRKFRSFVNENSFTYFIISLDDDLADASYSRTIKRILEDGGNFRIFVRTKNDNREKLNCADDKIIYFGDDEKLYTHENIVNDDLTELAQRINLLYNKISNPPAWLSALKNTKNLTAESQRKILNESLGVPANNEFMLKTWAALPYIEQASNIYHAMNLPFKLNLLGFDMVKKNGENAFGATEEEFNEYYVNSGRDAGYKDYSFFFKTESSNVLAYIEHSRWNALYILYDYKQMKKADMEVIEEYDKEGNLTVTMPHKNTALKQHACLTTYYGLNDLIVYKYKTMYPNATLNEENYKNDERLQGLGKIYAYDYMDLDRLYAEITAMGYILVKH